jgi:hypothetical protein
MCNAYSQQSVTAHSIVRCLYSFVGRSTVAVHTGTNVKRRVPCFSFALLYSDENEKDKKNGDFVIHVGTTYRIMNP